MSPTKRRLTLNPQAQLDVRDVLLSTRERWGREQRDRYRTRLHDAMRRLIDYPELGQPRDEIYPGCRGLRVEQHILLYRVTEAEIIIGRVLHVRQDPVGKVEP